jgi:hypothetical protein
MYRYVCQTISSSDSFQTVFQIFTAASMKMTVFWDVVTCSLVEVSRRFALIVEAPSTSETSVNYCQTTRHNIPGHSCLYILCILLFHIILNRKLGSDWVAVRHIFPEMIDFVVMFTKQAAKRLTVTYSGGTRFDFRSQHRFYFLIFLSYLHPVILP